MNLKKSLLITLTLSILSIGAWELYWRSQGYFPDLDDDKFLWANTRAKVDQATSNEVVLIGSSRVLFDIQLDQWQKQTGVKPIQLANAGASPLPVFHDIVENTDFNGTVVVGVTPGLFFSTTYPEAAPWKRAASRTEFYKNQTYAQQLNYRLSIPLQKSFAFISNDEEEWYDDINLKALLRTIKLPGRTKYSDFPPFNRFQDIDINRNVRMKDRMLTDTAFANSVKAVWKGMTDEDFPPPDKDGTIAFFLKDLEKLKARGGKVILLRLPSSGIFHDLESKVLPRKDFWDVLVQKANVPAYYYSDYNELSGFELPEWSHLSGPDAIVFTERLVKILMNDKVIANTKAK